MRVLTQRSLICNQQAAYKETFMRNIHADDRPAESSWLTSDAARLEGMYLSDAPQSVLTMNKDL